MGKKSKTPISLYPFKQLVYFPFLTHQVRPHYVIEADTNSFTLRAVMVFHGCRSIICGPISHAAFLSRVIEKSLKHWEENMDVTKKKKKKRVDLHFYSFCLSRVPNLQCKGRREKLAAFQWMANVFVSLIKSTSCQEIGTCDILWIAERLGYSLQVVICIHKQNVLRLSPSVRCKPKAEAWCIPSHD